MFPCFMCMYCICVSASTQQVEHVVVSLHVIALLVAAVPQHLVAAGEPALQPLWAGPPDRHGNVVRGGEFTPVEDVEPFCSFTVTQRGFTMLLFCGGRTAECVVAMHVSLFSKLFVSAAYLKAVIPECRW